MKDDSTDQTDFIPSEERAILDEIRNDRELIHRLGITSQELEALSKCALLGTLTCKQDMLFILRQVREATNSTIDQPTVFPKPAEMLDDPDPRPDLRRKPAQAAPIILPNVSSREDVVRRPIPARFVIIFWMVVLVVGLVCSGIVIISRFGDGFMTRIAAPVSQAPAPIAWYSNFDHLNVLLFWELLLVGAIALVMFLKSQRDSRRFKVRPGRSVR